MLAAIDDTPYNLVLLLHIVTVIVSMAGVFAHPLLFAYERRRPNPDVVALAQRVQPTTRLYAIVLVLTGVFGGALVGMSDDVFDFGQTWLVLAGVLWLAMNAVLHAVIVPAERKLAGGDTTALKRIEQMWPVTGLLMLVLVYLMVFKPGL